ncbi:Transposase IS66 family protein [Candidatus Methanophagaceae archaeon]|nr:Transposase IS66 family protein [Methanophagales archaeon]
MNISRITETLDTLNIRPDEIADERLAEVFRILLLLIEELCEENEKSKEENQKLRDAINLLKGEQAKPDIKSSRKKPNEDISSEEERKSQKTSKKKKSKAKKHKIKIDRVEVCKVDQNILPNDAEFKGYQNVVVQEIIIKTDNVNYKKEIYYSPSKNKTYMGELPPEVKGDFGPGVKSLVCTLKHIANVSEPKIHEFLDNFRIFISPASISRIITKNNELFHQEKADIFLAGLLSTDYQQIDDTSSRVRGQNYYTQIVCNPYYTAYFTAPHKDRLTVLDILRGDPDGKTRSYLFNEEAFDLLERFGVSKKLISQLRERVFGAVLDEAQMQQLLGAVFPDQGKGKIRRTRTMEAAAIAAYHQQTDFPIVEVLLSDDAPQYKLLIYLQALCWVHDGRNYKKLRPVVPEHREKLDEFRGKYWDYYQKLLQFGVNSSQEEAEALSAKFDQLFSTKTRYPALDERIAKSKAKKSELLMVLKHPELPLHNNDAELGARAQVRKRDVSLHTMTEDGTKANDTFLTIGQTAKKLGVSAYEYIYDRISERFRLPSLAELIRAKKFPEKDYDTG